MDHLNLPSLRAIVRENRRKGAAPPVIAVPSGVEDLVAKLGFQHTQIFTTWQTCALGPLTVTLTPAKHWGARRFDDVGRGYGGYVLSDGQRSIYFSGDTAYFAGFTEIGQRLHPEIALLPIGAYAPESFRSVHTSPEDALAAFHDLGSHTMIPMHYGTFRLSMEPMHEPAVRLMNAARQARVADRVLVLEEGQTRLFPPPASSV